MSRWELLGMKLRAAVAAPYSFMLVSGACCYPRAVCSVYTARFEREALVLMPLWQLMAMRCLDSQALEACRMCPGAVLKFLLFAVNLKGQFKTYNAAR